jgi:cytochrome c-type biogenesis protein CcmE
MRSRNKFVVTISGIILLVFVWIYWVSTNSDNENPMMIEYLTIDEIVASDSQSRVKMGGIIQDGSIVIDESDQFSATFVVEQDESSLAVSYYGTRPDLFKGGIEVIVEGNMQGDIFVADIVQTKCASRYEGDLREETADVGDAL